MVQARNDCAVHDRVLLGGGDRLPSARAVRLPASPPLPLRTPPDHGGNHAIKVRGALVEIQ